jgi:DNA-binding CsgD family transcriptional regulator
VATGRLAEAAAPGGGLGERLDDAAASQGTAGLRRLAEGALVAAADPAASVSLLIEAAEALERTPPAVVLPDTAHALGALMASVSGDVASAEYLLDRALATGAGGPVAAQRHRLLLAWVRMRAGRYDTAVAELARLPQAELSGRDRFLLVAISAGVARRSGDVARLRDAWIAVEPVLARRAVDLFGVEAVEELAVAATRLRRYARVAPVLDALDRIVAALGQPPAWAVAVDWIRMQVAIADEDAGAAAAVAARMAIAGGAAQAARPKAQYAAAGLWARVLAGDVDAGAVLAVAEELVAVELPWEASRLVGQAAIRTSDPGTARRLLERARELSSAEVSTDRRTETQHGGLSEREVEVARMVLAGDTYREIGGRLFISPKTVEHHVARIRNKLGASTRAEFLAALRDTLRDSAEATDQP